MIKYELKMETPSKKNGRTFSSRSHTLLYSDKYKAWHEYAALALRPLIRKCIEDKCFIILIFCHGDNARRDSDNGVNSIFDMLQDFKALKDDRWQIVRHHHVFNTYDKGNAWCKIYIYQPEEKEDYKRMVLNCIDEYE